ncbi:MAG: hypothetical protein ACR2M3_02015 [Thermomicrobiales bacterium]
MAETKYVVQLKGHEINGSKFSCEGEQIALVIETLGDTVQQCVWFVSDIDDQIDGPRLFPEGVKIPVLVGDHHETVDFLRQVSQFFWAVFLAVPIGCLPMQWGEIWAESEPFQDIGDAIVEICAFDSSSIQVYARDTAILEPIIARFGGEIRPADDYP